MSLNIKIILASVREGRFGDKPAEWITTIAKEKEELAVELLDLRDYSLPIFQEAVSPAQIKGDYRTPEINRWAKKLPKPMDSLLSLLNIITATHPH